MNSQFLKNELLESIEDQLQMYAFACRLVEYEESKKISRLSWCRWDEKQKAISYAKTRLELEHGILMSLIKKYGQKMYCLYCGKEAIYH